MVTDGDSLIGRMRLVTLLRKTLAVVTGAAGLMAFGTFGTFGAFEDTREHFRQTVIPDR
jgi:hypothetical protein